jgi:predicted RNA binding protein YcfA (HicA-like mRNA interferase family)
MSKIDKSKERLSLRPKDYTYSEAKNLLSQLGFREFNKGKTSGSRVKFYRASDQRIILLHKPHPGDEMSIGTIKDLATRLEEMGEL